MVHFGNDWDTILDGEFAKTYYQNPAAVSVDGIPHPDHLSRHV